MAYRIEQNITWRDMWNNLHTFLTELTNIYDINYESAQGDGVFSNLSVPEATATSETWTLICTNGVYPQTFSMQGNITGNTANVVVDTPYTNGIVYFTLSQGATPWEVNDIISFTTEATPTPAWQGLDANGVPPKVVTRFYQKRTAQYVPIKGQFMYAEGPKADSCSYTAEWQGKENLTSSAQTSSHTLIGRDVSYEGGAKPTLTQWAVSFWARKASNTLSDYHANSVPVYGALVAPMSAVDQISTFGVAVTDTYFHIYSLRDNSRYSELDLKFSTLQYYKDNPTNQEDWVLHSFNIDGEDLEAYLEDTSVGTHSHLDVSEVGYEIHTLLGTGEVSDVLVWDRLLTSQDRIDLSASTTRPDLESPDIIDGIIFDHNDLMPKIMVHNTDNVGNSISAVFNPQNEPYFSYNISMSFRGIQRYKNTTQIDLDFTYLEPLESRRIPSEWPCVSYNYLLGEDPSHIVEKYWFVASNEFIIVAYKTYDPTTPQQLPVYQVGYVGKSKTVEEMAYKVHLGTFSSGNDYWHTGSTSFRSGVFYPVHATWLSYFLYDRPEFISVSPIVGGFIDSANSYNVYPIVHHKTQDVNFTWQWAGISSYCTTQFPQRFGELHNINGIQAVNVDSEDIVIIDGIRHIALTDTTRAGSTSLILIKLD